MASRICVSRIPRKSRSLPAAPSCRPRSKKWRGEANGGGGVARAPKGGRPRGGGQADAEGLEAEVPKRDGNGEDRQGERKRDGGDRVPAAEANQTAQDPPGGDDHDDGTDPVSIGRTGSCGRHLRRRALRA